MAVKPPRIPVYLTTNRVGTYIFQVRIPRKIRQDNPAIKPTLWRSLGTKNRAEAIRRSKWMWIMFDKLSSKFSDPEVFGVAMKLLKEYDTHARGDWKTEVEPFLMGLGEEKNELLERALLIRGESVSEVLKLQEDNRRQQETIDYHNTGKTTRTYSDEQNPTIQVVVDRFMRDKLDAEVAESSENWYRSKVEQFASILEVLNEGRSPRLSEITGKMLSSYCDVLKRYPKNASSMPKTRHLTQRELVELSVEYSRKQLETQGIPVMSLSTIGHYFTAVRELLRYAHDKADVESGDFELSEKLIKQIKAPVRPKGQGRGSKPRIKFSQEDLVSMFNTGRYVTGTFKRNSEYWIPLLAAFGGQSQAELCQLHVSDVKQDRETGIWYLDINDQGGTDDRKHPHYKALKVDVDGRPRDVPIHHKLIELGFLDFVEQCRKNKQVRLFPEEHRGKQANSFDPYSKRFNRWRERELQIHVDSKGQKKDFHSYRHTVSGLIMGKGCHEGIANDIVGHGSTMRSETRKTYSDGTWLELKSEWINRIEYNLDWSKVVKWHEIPKLARDLN